jgi:O-methyltransferase
MLYQGVIVTEKIPGDAVEFGVWRGGSAGLISSTLQSLGSKRQLHLFDSFRGLPPPDPFTDGKSHREGEYHSDERDVRDFLGGLGTRNWHIYPGWLRETFSRVSSAIAPFSLVHVDVDLYGPIHDALQLTFDKLSPGGIVFIDDYGNPRLPGVARACQEFLDKERCQSFYLPTGQAMILK